MAWSGRTIGEGRGEGPAGPAERQQGCTACTIANKRTAAQLQLCMVCAVCRFFRKTIENYNDGLAFVLPAGSPALAKLSIDRENHAYRAQPLRR